MTGREAALQAAGQLQELTADGYPMAFVADTALLSPGVLYAIRAGHRQRIQYDTRDAITHTYLHLRGTDPAARGIPPGPICVAQLTAGRNGWTRKEET